jgi:hypothetical protein
MSLRVYYSSSALFGHPMSVPNSLRNRFETQDTGEMVVVGGSLSTIGLVMGTEAVSLALGLVLQVIGVGILLGTVLWGSGEQVHQSQLTE